MTVDHLSQYYNIICEIEKQLVLVLAMAYELDRWTRKRDVQQCPTNRVLPYGHTLYHHSIEKYHASLDGINCTMRRENLFVSSTTFYEDESTFDEGESTFYENASTFYGGESTCYEDESTCYEDESTLYDNESTLYEDEDGSDNTFDNTGLQINTFNFSAPFLYPCSTFSLC